MQTIEHKDPEFNGSGPLIVLERSLDFAGKPNDLGHAYEDICFEDLSRALASKLAIGPHMIDTIFNTSKRYAHEIRPDALFFDIERRCLRLSVIAEFKSGRTLDISRKLAGFSGLLRRLRRAPHFLPQQFIQKFQRQIYIPDVVILPQDREIEVTFVSPFADGVNHIYVSEEFPVTYRRVVCESL